jgi:hypothetical protein
MLPRNESADSTAAPSPHSVERAPGPPPTATFAQPLNAVAVAASAAGSSGGAAALLVVLLLVGASLATRRIVTPPLAVRPAPFVSLLERPG